MSILGSGLNNLYNATAVNSLGSLSSWRLAQAGSIAEKNPALPDIATTGSSVDFASMLQSTLKEVDQLQKTSDAMTTGMLLGSVEIHQATVAMEKATLTLRTVVQVRDKMLEAYQEITRMQV